MEFELSEDEVRILLAATGLGVRSFFDIFDALMKPWGIKGAYTRWESSSQDLISFVNSLNACKTFGEVIQLLKLRSPVQADDDEKEDMVAAEKAWKTSYTGYNNVLTLLDEQLRYNAAVWNPVYKYAPLAAVVQSSGWGKSRLICQLYEKNMYVLYISCLREDETDSAYPRRTEELVDVLVSEEESNILALVYSILQVLNGCSISCEEWIQSQLEPVKGEESVVSKIAKVYDATAKMIAPPRGDDEQYAELLGPELRSLRESNKFLLLCVDEATQLSSPTLARLGRMLRYVPAEDCFFSVLVGTGGTVGDLAATYNPDAEDADDDPGSRVRLLSGVNQPYEPICLVGKSDVLVQELGHPVTRQEQVLQYGRPLWAAYMRALDNGLSESGRVDTTIQLAKKKLLGDEVDLNKPGWVTREVAVAVFGYLIGLDVVPWSDLSQELAARHMRTIVKISHDRKRVYTAIAAEPALAAAAAELLHHDNDKYLRDFIARLIEVCMDGLVLENIRGKMVIRLILLLAIHECTKRDRYIKAVPLAEFLTSLFGREVVEQLQEQTVQLNVSVFFNSFLPTGCRSSNMHCRECYKRNVAIIEQDMDLTVPCEPLPGPLPKLKRRRNPESIFQTRSLMLQVKNFKARKCDRVMRILFQVEAAEESITVNEGDVTVNGLCFKFIANELKPLLKRLASTCEDIFNGFTDMEKALLEELIPLGSL